MENAKMNISIPNTNAMNVDYKTKMMEAQSLFRRVVKAELQILLDQQVPRDVAVKNLLQRIVKCAAEPSEAEVKKVMCQFQMNRDDAVRALVVKQELARLKQRGLDSFAAIEELTLKMQLLLPLSPMSNRDSDDEARKESSQVETLKTSISQVDAKPEAKSQDNHEEINGVGNASPAKSKRKRKASSRPCPSSSQDPQDKKLQQIEDQPSSAPDADDANLSSKEVSLCQRIINCSISSASPLDASDSTTVKRKSISRKRRNNGTENEAPPELPKGNRYGAKKKLRLDVDQKIKTQIQDSFVLMKTIPQLSKSSKRIRPKSDSVDGFSAKKHRSE